MLQLIRSQPPAVSATSAVAFTLRLEVTVLGQILAQSQFATERYVLTETAGTLVLFCAERGERFVVDQSRRRLQAIDSAPHLAQVGPLRQAIGALTTRVAPLREMVGGYSCRRIEIEATEAAVVIHATVHAATLAGIERTALAAERRLLAGLQPFDVPLEDGEILVRSESRVLARGFEQNQLIALKDASPGIETLADTDLIPSYPVDR